MNINSECTVVADGRSITNHQKFKFGLIAIPGQSRITFIPDYQLGS